MHFQQYLHAIAIFAPVIFANVISKRNDAENILLSNCADINGGSISSEIGYYSGIVSGRPAASVTVATGRNQIWEGAPVSGTFSDGNVFTADIPSHVGNGVYAGTGQNHDASFYCYGDVRSIVYQNAAGAYCGSLYVCGHKAPTTSSKGISVAISTNSDYVELTNMGYVNAYDIFQDVWNQRGIRTCNEARVDLGHGCSIKFVCHADDDWTTTNGMASTLVGVVAKQDAITQHWTSQNDYCGGYCAVPGGSGTYCCNPQSQTVQHTKIMQGLGIYVTNLDSNSDAGSLTYDIQCAPPSTDCSLFSQLGASLNLIGAAGGPVAPEVAAYFSAAGAILTASGAGGC